MFHEFSPKSYLVVFPFAHLLENSTGPGTQYPKGSWMKFLQNGLPGGVSPGFHFIDECSVVNLHDSTDG